MSNDKGVRLAVGEARAVPHEVWRTRQVRMRMNDVPVCIVPTSRQLTTSRNKGQVHMGDHTGAAAGTRLHA